jgi:hypothetical protein
MTEAEKNICGDRPVYCPVGSICVPSRNGRFEAITPRMRVWLTIAPVRRTRSNAKKATNQRNVDKPL